MKSGLGVHICLYYVDRKDAVKMVIKNLASRSLLILSVALRQMIVHRAGQRSLSGASPFSPG